jgi:hypothetical protein
VLRTHLQIEHGIEVMGCSVMQVTGVGEGKNALPLWLALRLVEADQRLELDHPRHDRKSLGVGCGEATSRKAREKAHPLLFFSFPRRQFFAAKRSRPPARLIPSLDLPLS